MPSDLPRMTVRAPQELIDKIKEISTREHRTANEQMNYIMSKFIEEYEAQQTKKQESGSNVPNRGTSFKSKIG